MTKRENPYEEIYRLVGSRIRDERTSVRMSQEDLAAHVGLTRTSIVNIEKGRQKVLIHTLILIAGALKVTPSKLLGGVGEPQESLLLKEMPENATPNIRDWIITSVKRATSTTKARVKS